MQSRIYAANRYAANRGCASPRAPTLYCQEAFTISLAARSFARRTGSSGAARPLLSVLLFTGLQRERPATWQQSAQRIYMCTDSQYQLRSFWWLDVVQSKVRLVPYCSAAGLLEAMPSAVLQVLLDPGDQGGPYSLCITLFIALI